MLLDGSTWDFVAIVVISVVYRRAPRHQLGNRLVDVLTWLEESASRRDRLLDLLECEERGFWSVTLTLIL